MALSVSNQASVVGAKLIVDTTANASGQQNVTNDPSTIYMIEVDNTLNVASRAYLKLYDQIGVTVGTTAPDFIFVCAGGVKRSLAITEGMAFSNGLSYALTTVGGTSGTQSLAQNVIVRMVVS